MKKFLSLMLIAMLSISLVACANKTVDEEEQAPELISGVKVTMQDEKTAVIELEGNPTTGYKWIPLSYDDQTLKIEEEYVSSVDNSKLPPEEQVMGAGGVFKFTVTGLRQGKTLVDFTYLREWEGQNSAIENHPVEIQVAEDMTLYIPIA